MADGNEATPIEVDAQGKGEEKGNGKNKDKSKEGAPDKSSLKCFFCEEKGHSRKDCLEFTTWRAEKKQTGHEPSANAIKPVGSLLFCFGPKRGSSQEPTRLCLC